MPEIAEVRTVASTLNRQLVGRKIIDIEMPYSRIIEGDPLEFKNALLNRRITGVDNFGKWMFIHLDDLTILSHLRMEGKYFLKDSSDPIEKPEHIIFHLDNGHHLRYHDTRKFGRMHLVKTEDIYKTPEISKLGIEPDDDKLSSNYLYDALKKRTLPIKTLLLDQSIINGLGNIYVDEVLFAAKINPLKKGSDISLEECSAICKNAARIIKLATSLGGTTIRSYTSSLGVTGHYQDNLKVHTHDNEPCPDCGTTIEKIRIGGRGTYYCPNCQKLK